MKVAGEHDVIVVGAGPAGATVAIDLVQRGYDVLLLDRNQFPRDKACGDAVSLGCIEILHRLGLGDKIAAAEARGEFYPLWHMRLVSPGGHMLHADFKEGQLGERSYVAPRLFFDAVIQQHAVESGAKFLAADVKEPIIENGSITGVRARVNGDVKELRSRVVIGADGVTSAVMRHVRPESSQHKDSHRAVALRAYIEDLELFPNEVEFYLYKDVLPGYAWIFPTADDKANIGLGMRLDLFRKLKKNLKKMLSDFLEKPAIRERLKQGGIIRDVAIWQLNFGSQKRLQHTFDGAILIGDAAGFINPLTGGGIHNALISAELAAQTIDNAFRKGDVSRQGLIDYEKLCHDMMWEGMRYSYFLQRWLLRFPPLIDLLMKRLDQNSGLAKTFLNKL
jgi:geranylgeranyl reductase family protein